jgi:hypothetical protein
MIHLSVHVLLLIFGLKFSAHGFRVGSAVGGAGAEGRDHEAVLSLDTIKSAHKKIHPGIRGPVYWRTLEILSAITNVGTCKHLILIIHQTHTS